MTSFTSTASTPSKSSSARNLSSLFSWNKSRQVMPLNCFLEMDAASPRTAEFGEATELTQMDDENAHLCYTSLRDLLPAAASSRPGSPVKPKHRAMPEGREEKPEEEVTWSASDRPAIKNRLVEQAARAYLLPTSPQKTPPDQFLARYWAKLTASNNNNPSRTESQLWSAPAAAPRHSHGCIHGCTHGCLSCLPSLIWVDLSRVVHALFSQLRPKGLLRDRAHSSTAIISTSSLMTPSVVK